MSGTRYSAGHVKVRTCLKKPCQRPRRLASLGLGIAISLKSRVEDQTDFYEIHVSRQFSPRFNDSHQENFMTRQTAALAINMEFEPEVLSINH